MIATPVFGYKSHISIDRRFGFIRESAVTSAAAPDGRMLRQLLSDENTSMEVWAPLGALLRNTLPGSGHRIPLTE